MSRIRGTRLRTVAVLAAAALLLVACGSSDGSDAEPQTKDVDASVFQIGPRNVDDSGEPTEGGSFTFGEWSQPATLDPALYYISGAIGGIEFAAIYDPLVRYDPVQDEYSPQMAEAVEPNDDFTTWTVTLREGVTFTDGTPFDSEAVKYNVDRLVEKSAQNSDLITEWVTSIDTPDARTVVFNLKGAWPGFEFLLASNVGYIGSPTAMKAEGDAFGTKPVGAGPFMLKSFVPAEEIELVANPDYWNGRPPLDSVRFVPVNGELTRLDMLESGDVDAAFFRDFEASQKAVEAGFPGYMNLSNGGWILSINNRDGRPGHDVRVRQAIAYAVDPEVINQRFLGGYGVAGKDLFLPWSKWASDVHGLENDPAKAKELLAAAKEDGYDGKITLEYSTSENYALSTQAMLKSVGFDVELKAAATVPEFQTDIFVDHDFDMVPTAMDMSDASVAVNLRGLLLSERSAYIGATDRIDEWKVLIDKLWAATTDEEKKPLMAEVQTLWNETMPGVTTSALAKYIAWDTSIHGIQPTIDDIVLLGDAWREPS